MVIASLADLGRLDRPGADFHAGVNFALTAFSELPRKEAVGSPVCPGPRARDLPAATIGHFGLAAPLGIRG